MIHATILVRPKVAGTKVVVYWRGSPCARLSAGSFALNAKVGRMWGRPRSANKRVLKKFVRQNAKRGSVLYTDELPS